MTRLKDRMIRAAKLDIDLYEEVEADQGALGQAMVVVVLSSAAAALLVSTDLASSAFFFLFGDRVYLKYKSRS